MGIYILPRYSGTPRDFSRKIGIYVNFTCVKLIRDSLNLKYLLTSINR